MGEWSPSHTLIVIFVVVGFIGQVAVYFYRTAQNDKKIDKQSEDIKQLGETFFHALERLEDRMDKRFVEVINTMNQQISDVRSEIAGVRSEMNQRLSEMQTEIRDVRSEMSDMRSEMSKLNQNHIEHLNRHHG